MTELERIDRLTEPVVKGRFYLVPIVFATWLANEPRDWPVIGAMHSDLEFFNFPEPHYHVDGRFVSQIWHRDIYRVPLTRPYGAFKHRMSVPDSSPLPKPVLKRRKCIHAHIPYSVYDDQPAKMPTQIVELRAAYSDHQCEHGKAGWICPHRKASLGSVVPIDGVITCPLHGLRIDAATGKVLPFEASHVYPMIAGESVQATPST